MVFIEFLVFYTQINGKNLMISFVQVRIGPQYPLLDVQGDKMWPSFGLDRKNRSHLNVIYRCVTIQITPSHRSEFFSPFRSMVTQSVRTFVWHTEDWVFKSQT